MQRPRSNPGGFMDRRRLAAGSAVLLALCATASAAHAQVAYDFALPPQALADSLRAVGSRAGVNVAFDPATVKGKSAPALRGSFSVQEALGRLTAGSGLSVRSTAGGSFVVEGPLGPPDQAAARAAPVEPARPIDQLVVTGTHIYGTSPVETLTQVSRADLERGGFLDLGQALRSLPGNFAGGQNVEALAAGGAVLDNSNRTIPGAASVNLHGLGSSATLVLLNGARLPPIGYGLSADVSMIPLSTIERIDVLADGASSIYGADAVAGVVNIVTRRTFDGLEGQLRYGGAEGGLETYNASLVAGTRAGPFSGVAGVEAFRQDPLSAAKRERSQTADQPTNLFGKTTRASAYASGRLDVGPRVEIFADGLYMQRELTDTWFSRPSIKQVFVGDTKVFEYSASAGLVAHVSDDWRLDATATTGRNVTKDVQVTNSLTGVRLRAPVVRYDNRLSSVEAQLSGPIVVLPAGGVNAAFGVAARQEESDQRLATGRVNPHRRVQSAYAEIDIPLANPARSLPFAQKLDLVLAGRAEHYSDFGNVSEPKVGVSWSPLSSVTIRSVFSKSFRAPSAFDLSNAYFAIVTDARDNSPAGLSRVLYLSGTGRPLGPERSKNVNVGVTFEPDWLPGLRLDLDYYRIDYTNRIASPDPNVLLAFDIRNAPPQLLQSNPTLTTVTQLLAGAFSVIPVGVPSPVDPGRIAVLVDGRSLNVARTRIAGLDFTGQYRHELAAGDLTVTATVNRIDRFEDQVLPGSPTVERVGTIFSPTKLRSRLGVVWSYRGLESAAYWNYTDSYVDNRLMPATTVDSWNTFDLSVAYRFGANASSGRGPRVILSITNLTDEAPPEIRAGLAPRQSYRWDGTNASIVGRFVSFTVTQRW